MSQISGKHRKRYVDNIKDRYKLTCLDHVPGNLSDECNVLGDFSYKYSKIKPTKDRGYDPAAKKNLAYFKRTML